MIGIGVKIGYSAASPVSWLETANIRDFSLPQLTSDRVEKTVHSRTSRIRRYDPGLQSSEDAYIELLNDFTDADQTALKNYKAARTQLWFCYELPANDALTSFVQFIFQARVADFNISSPLEGEQTIRFVLMFDGDGIQINAAGSAVSMS